MTKKILLIISLCLGFTFAVGGIEPAYALSTCNTDADCGLALRCGANCGSASQCEFCYSNRVCVDLTGDGFKHCEVLTSCDYSSTCPGACCDGCPCFSPPQPTNTPAPSPTPIPVTRSCHVQVAPPTAPGGTTRITVSGISGPASQIVAGYVQRNDVALINPRPIVDGTSVDPVTFSGRNYYQLGQCTATAAGKCTFTVDVDLPTLEASTGYAYIATCLARSGGGGTMCSGNPTCTYERSFTPPVPASVMQDCSTVPSISCDGPSNNQFASLGLYDNALFEVTAIPTPSPSPTATPAPSPTPGLAPLTVNIYEDVCFGTNPLSTSGSVTDVKIDGPTGIFTTKPLVPGDSSVTYPTMPAGVYSAIDYTKIPGLFKQDCPGSESTIVGPGGGEINLYFLPGVAGWWQAADGDIAANTGSVSSSVPSSCQPSAIPACFPHLMLESTASSQGVILTQSGPSGNTYGAALGDETQPPGSGPAPLEEYVVEGHTTIDTSLIPREDFDYFVRLLELPADTTARVDDWADNNPSWGDQMPGMPQLVAATPGNAVSAPGSSTKIFYKGSDLTYDGTSGSQSLYTVDSDKVIVVVDGNLTLRNFNSTTGHALKVINNGFIGFIVSGNIIIEDTVGNTSAAYGTPNLQGVFVASGNITALSGDLQLAARGTYVGWGDINFNRSLPDTDNNTTPAEVFTYDPELIMNAPRELRRARLIWSEIAPQKLTP